MMQQKSRETNPLRISQDDIDINDIISDLNSEKSQLFNNETTHKTTKNPVIQNKSTLNKNSSKSHIGGKSTRTYNKENDSNVINRQHEPSTVAKGNKMGISEQKEQILQQTVETKAATSEKNGLQYSSTNSVGNQRYDESNIKSQSIEHHFDTEELQEEHLRQPTQMPFYLKQQQTLTSDEDVESFQRKLDTLIVNFRSETMSEFMKTKRQVMQDQVQTIDAERRRCNTLLGVKQNEIEQLKESLGAKTKLSDDLNTRCEGMAFWSGKAKMLLRIKLLQHQAFDGLKKNRDFEKHSKKVLEHRLRQHKENMKRRIFQEWGKQYKEWKVVKNREDFEKAVKLELQHICAQYNKEIETLRERLNEAQAVVDSEHRTKAMMQENLKKAFMRGVCALNFEAMNILNPNDQNYQQQIEKEMEKQVMNAMNQVAEQSPFTYNQTTQRTTIPVRPPIFQSASDHTLSPQSTSFEQEGAYQERKMMNIDSAQVNPFSQNIAELTVPTEYKKIESKDSMWKPAPIMGREIHQQVQPSFTYSQPSITSQLKGPQNGVVLSSHFNKQQTPTTQSFNNNDLMGVMSRTPLENPALVRIEEDSEYRTMPGNPTVIQGSSSLPDFISGGMPAHTPHGEGKTIIAHGNQTGTGKSINKVGASTVASKKPTSTIGSSALSKKK